jgi:hypothetical protein
MTSAHFKTVESRLRTIASLPPFSGGSAEARRRPARSSRAANWPRGTLRLRDGAQLDVRWCSFAALCRRR